MVSMDAIESFHVVRILEQEPRNTSELLAKVAALYLEAGYPDDAMEALDESWRLGKAIEGLSLA